MITPTRLSLYNGALRELGERKLANVSENREPRRLLDDAWDAGAVEYCLGAAQWRFAKRTVEMSPDTGIDPAFGYTLAYELPEDHIRTCEVSGDEYFNIPLTAYRYEAGWFFTDANPLFLSYVSSDASYGFDYSKWEPDFVRFVEVYLASQIVSRVTQDKTEWDRVYKLADRLRKEASSADAMEDPQRFPPTGSWVSSRLGRSAGRRDRGGRGSLIG